MWLLPLLESNHIKTGKKYYYYQCKKCKPNHKEVDILEFLAMQIVDLVKLDDLMNNYYTPFIKSKLDNKEIDYEKQIKELDKQLDRINAAYIKGIVKENELEKANIKYDSLKSFISNLLQLLKGLFKKILSIGTDKEKNLVSEQLKECYDTYLYSESIISNIVKNTPKEIELTNYIEEKDYDYF